MARARQIRNSDRKSGSTFLMDLLTGSDARYGGNFKAILPLLRSAPFFHSCPFGQPSLRASSRISWQLSQPNSSWLQLCRQLFSEGSFFVPAFFAACFTVFLTGCFPSRTAFAVRLLPIDDGPCHIRAPSQFRRLSSPQPSPLLFSQPFSFPQFLISYGVTNRRGMSS